MIKYILLLFLIFPINCYSASYDVGGGNNDYPTVTACLAAVDINGDDIINVYPGTYTDEWNVGTSDGGTAGHPVLIRGVDSGGTPITAISDLVTFNMTTWTDVGDDIDIYGDYVIIQGFNFSYSQSPNAALTSNASYTIVRYCKFYDCFGSFTADGDTSGDVVVEYCEFDTNDSGNHQLYSGWADHLIIQYCYFHGHNDATHNIIKTRDITATIRYNYIDMGNSAYAIDGCHNGDGVQFNGNVNVYGNVILSTVDGIVRNGMVKWGQEAGRYGSLYVINNTFIRTSNIDPDVFSVNLADGYTWEVSNNIFYNFADLTRVDNMQDLIGANNWVHTGTSNDGLTNSVNGVDPGFLTLEHGGYHINNTSACYNAGVAASITPTYEYQALAGGVARASDATIDIGAFEYSASGDTTSPVVEISTATQTVQCDSISISWTDGDNIAVTGRKWRIGSAPDGSNGTAATSPATVTGMVIGVNTIYIGAGDAAGNWGSDSVAITYTGICQPEVSVGRYGATGAHGVYSSTGAIIQ